MDVLNYISDMQSARGVTPKLREIAAAFGVSLGSVRYHLRALSRKGWLTRTRYAHRGIRLTRGRREGRVRRRRQGEFDRRIGSRLADETDLSRIFALVGGELRTWLDVERADLFVHDPQQRVLRGRSFYENRPPEDAAGETLGAGAGTAVDRAYRRRRIVQEPPRASGGLAGTGADPAVVAVPVPGRDRVLGVLRLEDRRPERPGPETMTRTALAVAALAPALERSSLHADIRRRIRMQAALVSLCRTINSVRDLEGTLREMYAIIAGLVEAPVFLVSIRDDRGQWWLLHERDEVDGRVIERIGPRRIVGEEGVSLRMLDDRPCEIRHRTPEEIRAYERGGPGAAGDGLKAAGFTSKRSRSLLFVPLKSGGRRFGNLSVQSYRYNAYRLQDAEDLILIGEYVGLAVRNALRGALTRDPTLRPHDGGS